MERYSWMLILTVMGSICLVAFFFFIFKDMKNINELNLSQKNYILDYSLLGIVMICIVLAVYLYFDVQKQIQLLEKIM